MRAVAAKAGSSTSPVPPFNNNAVRISAVAPLTILAALAGDCPISRAKRSAGKSCPRVST